MIKQFCIHKNLIKLKIIGNINWRKMAEVRIRWKGYVNQVESIGFMMVKNDSKNVNKKNWSAWVLHTIRIILQL